MIVVIIIGFLASVVGPQLISRVGQSRQVTAQSQLQSLEMALNHYYLDCGRYPTTEQGLNALIAEPSIAPTPNGWTGPYLTRQELPKDPWGYSYFYKSPGDYNQNGFDLYSLGKDDQEGGSGENADVTNWSTTAR
ncbi:MAG: type II secretion system major pseudopilin GspG [Halanaerobiales bacterium]|nr:type II secretion system major pseudopilin GspG [Halanaerobiales bacterium]